ncbi:hypothetical protein JYT71_01245 [Acidimicrobiaceae bacterium AH-315-P05]|nr:hypothetical protein [Acidimicrobiaceae bacterium AH-315-P05]
MTGWQRARIIPVSGIGSEREAEQRATSALLAVMGIVRPFSQVILSPLGASRAGRAVVETFIEPSFKDDDGKVVRPDGLIQVAYGKKAPFVALVEVKTGSAKLGADQINAYWDVARREGFDAVITISNEIAPSFGVHPTEGLKVRSNSKVAVHHLSWTRVLSLAVTEKTHRGIDDPEQDWILGELIRYLEHDASGTLGFDDMGTNWVEVRDGARNGTLNAKSDGVTDIALRWDQLLSFVSLRLGADIGEDVVEVLSRAEQNDPKLRPKLFAESLCRDGTLSGTLRVPNTVGDIQITVDLKARQNIVSVDVNAPGDKGAKGRISWLIRQLSDAPSALVIEAYPKGGQTGIAGSLEALAEDPSILLRDDKKDPHRFRVIARSELGQGRRSGKSPGFVQSVINAIESFYGDVLQDMTAYQQRAPQLKSVVPHEPAPDLPSVPLIPATPSPSPNLQAPLPPPASPPWHV